MKANELVIGDWVLYNETHQQILEISGIDDEVYLETDELVHQSEIQPIPLTPEILEKNGFEDWDGWSIYSPENTGIEIAWLGTILKIGGECGNLELPAIEYVHQLQHALRLCGIEKTIEL